ncbi:ABC transporter permease protein [Rhodopirellula maiorica SM1]|uniref:ABC transporter permease protein n=1 Tax=Rhodopirellula maiorica SM1 TaxID=1265738 RepID=M5RRE4_9BACT|nr:ABC transporter permease [Rhodopirellula maiorica]EMI16539.1 ABC transporter permease protein [Rhodopirellula maiorica SM1]
MLWNIAFQTLLYDRGKLFAGLIGVIFSVVLVNIQGGLFFGLIHKASLLVDRSGADIWVGHSGMHNVDFPHNIPERWIYRIRSIEGVQAAEPIRIGFGEISLPDGNYEGVNVVGITEGTDLGRAFEIVEGPEDALSYSDGVIVDQCDNQKLLDPAIGDVREISGNRVRISGKSHGVLSFLVNPYVFTTYVRAAEFVGSDPSTASYFLVRVKPGVDREQVCAEIRRRLSDVAAMPAEEYAAISVNFWMTRTGIGLSFGAATFLGLLVGLVMVGQTLYAMVLDRISEFATLKAIGASEREIVVLLTAQSGMVAIVGIAVGLAFTVGIRHLFSTPQASIQIPPGLYIASAALVFTICLAASALPYLRVRRVDPHSVLQG